jgi:hypothetical protein
LDNFMNKHRVWSVLCLTALGLGSTGIPLADAATREFSTNEVITAQAFLVRCEVVGIRTGQLALRFEPNGASRAGLNNGNIVDVFQQNGLWWYVEVITGPRGTVGLRGWVNSDYLGSCED